MKHEPIKFLRTNFLRGPSIWTYRPAVETVIDLGELEDYPSNKIPGFAERLEAWLPSLIEHTCSPGYRGGFVERLKTGTWPGHIMEHVALELQNLAGMQGTFGKAREMNRRGVYKVVVGTHQEEVGRRALADARDLVMAAINDEPFDVKASVRGLRELIDRHALGPSTADIVEAAYERRIPAIRLTEGNLVQLGYGARQRRIWTAETDRTSAIAEGISRDKDLTKQLLEACGIPIPEGRIVANPEEAWEAAQEIGFPVVVKPSDGNHARGVVLDLYTREAIEAAFPLAQRQGTHVIVERCIQGQEHRLLIVGGKLVAAARGELAYITGDGRSTVTELIDSQINSDPRRGEEEDFPLDVIHVPENATVMLELQRQGVTPDSIPEAGRELLVQRTGVMTHDITDEVHPEVAEIGALAARVVGLDIAGIDLVASDISRPLHEQGGAIVEVNAGPSLLMHLKPLVGKPRPCGKAIIDHLFGPDEDGYIPIVGVTGGEHTTAVAMLASQLLYRAGFVTGLACGGGMYLQGQRIQALSDGDWEAGQRILMSRTTTAAVVESNPRSILENGLPYDRCQIGVVTGVPAPLGLDDHYVATQDDMRNVLRTQIDVVLRKGCAVLNADDEVCAGLAELCDGSVLFYSAKAEHPLQVAHCAAGGRFLLVRDNKIVLCTPDSDIEVLDLRKPVVASQLQRNAPLPAMLAAVGAALALDLSPALVRAGVEAGD